MKYWLLFRLHWTTRQPYTQCKPAIWTPDLSFNIFPLSIRRDVFPTSPLILCVCSLRHLLPSLLHVGDRPDFCPRAAWLVHATVSACSQTPGNRSVFPWSQEQLRFCRQGGISGCLQGQACGGCCKYASSTIRQQFCSWLRRLVACLRLKALTIS